MIICCPHCGERGNEEFVYLGDANLKDRPDLARPLEDWVRYVYFRRNAAGLHNELWHHSYGCRQWLVVRRDTTNHKVITALDVKAFDALTAIEIGK